MSKIIGSIIGFVGGLLMLYALALTLMGMIPLGYNDTAYFQEKLQLGFTIALNVGLCGGVLVAIALVLWFVVPRRAARPE